jgi:epoxyqueuosine reductase
MSERQEELRQRLFALGFDDVRFAQTGNQQDNGKLRDWLAAGYHADMAWIERTVEKRLNPELVLPDVKAAILLGVNYWPGKAIEENQAYAKNPRWARYALYQDYHDTMKTALVAAGRALEELYTVGARDYRYYVDTGPVLERGWASEAGLGFIGKNGMLISQRFGNWLFLAAILTRVEFKPDDPLKKRFHPPHKQGRENDPGLLCGKCTRCQAACPTQAIPRPGVIDARRCISYQTIENRGIIPREFRAAIGTRIYGCDVCLEVCPWNRFAQESRRILLSARGDLAELTLHEILSLTPERFADVFRKTAIKRIKLSGLLRNACIVAANTPAPECLAAVVDLAVHPAPTVRAHAVWAVFRLAGAERGKALLDHAHAGETEPMVLAEYAFETGVAQ